MEELDPVRYVTAFLLVIGLIGLMALLLRRFGTVHIKNNAMARLRIEEVRPIDTRRKLVLVKRDDTEHLLLLADGREMIIESGIQEND